MRHAQRERIRFTGTGTFITRLLQSGLITAADLQRKYSNELHANEIMLLAYYIAAVNIETTYHALVGKTAGEDDYEPFPGIVLADTFQISEADDSMDAIMFPHNNARIETQLATPINVIATNPPYSAGQSSANDMNANVKYPALDGRIEDSYAKRSTAKLKNSLYDSYIRAFRWATDRIGEAGIVGFVSNGGWIDGNTADGMRLSLADDYSAIYVYNLRGNQRTAGELSRREGGKVFGSGSRNTVAIFIGVRDGARTGPCQLFYRDIGDYLSREEKLRIVGESHLGSLAWQTITPNTHGDWLSQRDDTFGAWPVIGDKDGGIRVFTEYSGGLLTARDPWVYNFSMTRLKAGVRSMIDFYNSQVADFDEFCEEHKIPAVERKSHVDSFIDADPTKISWGGGLQSGLATGTQFVYSDETLVESVYRPFNRELVAFDRQINCRVYRLPSMFPTPHQPNIGFYVVGAGSSVPFSAIMSDLVPDRHVTGAGSGGQFFPRWTYEKVESDDGGLDFDTSSGEVDEYGYRRIDNVTDDILALYREAVGDQVTKDDIFYYVYGLLHDPAYRQAYAADLKKMLPHIPTPESRERFDQLADAGRKLAELHVNYESVQPYPLDVQLKAGTDPDDPKAWRVDKMKWAKKKDPETGKNIDDITTLVYSGKVTITGIPEEAERYMLGSRSALAWLIDRYQVKTDKASGIVNDPNDWCNEHDDPRYIVDLIAKVTTVTVETMKIVDNLAEAAAQNG